MTDLLARIRATEKPVVNIATNSEITRAALSNAMYGRRRLSPAASARVEAVLVKLEVSRRERIAESKFAESVVSALTASGTP